jgi:spectinomycin phosphotransferase
VKDEADLVRLIDAEFGVHVRELRPVGGGWDAAAVVHVGADDEGRLWSVKQTTRDVTFGLTIARALLDAGVEGVSTPLVSRDGDPWVQVDGRTLTVSRWVDGVDAADADLDALDWEQLGRVLRRVHDLPPPARRPAGRRGVRRASRSPRSLVDELDLRFVSQQRSGDDTLALRERWSRAAPRLRALAKTERALKRTRTPTARVTLHGDPHLGNIVIDSTGRPWLIDFDESTVAPREVDLMLIELGVLFDRPIGDEHRARFRRGYGADAVVDPERIARFGIVRAVEDVTDTFHRALDRSIPAPSALAVLDGILGPRGLVTLVEREIATLDLPAPAPQQRDPQ